jgi:peptide/nickel transport system ATP-binding protein
MVLKPEVVVADEPTSMLDASISAQIFNILRDMRNHLDVTLIFITHSLAAARYLCDRVAVMYKGSLMEVAPADEVIQNPKHPYTQALIDALPKFGSCEGIQQYGTLLAEKRRDADGAGCPFYPRCKRGQRMPCSQEMPRLEPMDDSHWAACFYVGEDAEPGSEGDACYSGT